MRLLSDLPFDGLLQPLAANSVLVMAAMLLYLLVLEGRLSKGSWRWSVVIGCGFGAMAVVSMLFPVTVRPGILSDAKFTLTVFSAAYGGPLAGAVTALIAGVFRGYIGGLGFYATIPVLVASWALGLLYARWSLPAQNRARRALQLLLLGYTLSLLQLFGLSFFLFFMEWEGVLSLMKDFALPILVVFPPFSVLLGLALDFIDSRHHIGELQKRTASALEKRNKEIEVLNDVFHHELRTPVVSLQGFMSDLRENAREGKMQEVLQDVEYLQKATDRIGIMLEALVRLNRAGIRSGREPSSWLPSVGEALCERWPALRVDPLDQVYVAIESHALGHLLDALLDNAFKFSAGQAEPQVVLSSSLERQGLVLVVSDNGIGLAPQYRQRIFRLFEKLHADEPGIGVGLTIAERIAKSYGGSIEACSEGEGLGCQMRVWLPLAAPSKQTKAV